MDNFLDKSSVEITFDISKAPWRWFSNGIFWYRKLNENYGDKNVVDYRKIQKDFPLKIYVELRLNES